MLNVKHPKAKDFFQGRIRRDSMDGVLIKDYILEHSHGFLRVAKLLIGTCNVSKTKRDIPGNESSRNRRLEKVGVSTYFGC